MVIAITQSKNIKELQVEEVIGSLCEHETILIEDKLQKKGKMIALKTSEK